MTKHADMCSSATCSICNPTWLAESIYRVAKEGVKKYIRERLERSEGYLHWTKVKRTLYCTLCGRGVAAAARRKKPTDADGWLQRQCKDKSVVLCPTCAGGWWYKHRQDGWQITDPQWSTVYSQEEQLYNQLRNDQVRVEVDETKEVNEMYQKASTIEKLQIDIDLQRILDKNDPLEKIYRRELDKMPPAESYGSIATAAHQVISCRDYVENETTGIGLAFKDVTECWEENARYDKENRKHDRPNSTESDSDSEEEGGETGKKENPMENKTASNSKNEEKNGTHENKTPDREKIYNPFAISRKNFLRAKRQKKRCGHENRAEVKNEEWCPKCEGQYLMCLDWYNKWNTP